MSEVVFFLDGLSHPAVVLVGTVLVGTVLVGTLLDFV
jgi:hypothetical protein